MAEHRIPKRLLEMKMTEKDLGLDHKHSGYTKSKRPRKK
jgi:hypothetical protein